MENVILSIYCELQIIQLINYDTVWHTYAAV